MKVKELIEELKKQDPDATVWVDWDCEGGNEQEASEIQTYERTWAPGNSIVIR